MTDPTPVPAAEALLGRAVTEPERRAMAAEQARLLAHVVASPLASAEALFTAQTTTHAALIARVAEDVR